MIDISVSTFSVTKETQFSTFTVVSFIDSRLCKAFHKQLLTVTASRSSLGTQQEVSIKKQWKNTLIWALLYWKPKSFWGALLWKPSQPTLPLTLCKFSHSLKDGFACHITLQQGPLLHFSDINFCACQFALISSYELYFSNISANRMPKYTHKPSGRGT